MDDVKGRRCNAAVPRALSKEESFLTVTDWLYEAALDGAKWSSALRGVADVIGGTACGVRFESFATPNVKQTWFGLEPAWESAYLAHYWQDDIWAVKARAFRPGDFNTSDGFLEEAVRRKSSFINELCAPFEIDDLVGGVVDLSPVRMISFATMKQRGQRPYGHQHAVIVGQLMPHLKRVLMIEEALRDAREGERTAWSLVDRLPVGAIVLDARRRVLHQNEAATRMIAAGISLDSRPLREVVATLKPARLRVGAKSYAVVALRLPSEEGAFGITNARGSTLLLVTDPSARVLPPVELLMAVYGLTVSEARVALLVGGGCAPKEAANELGTAWNTVRAQLRQVFAKTQTSGQPALVRLLTQLGLSRV